MLMTAGATVASSTSQTSASSSAKFEILSPGDRYAGMTYGEWSAAWWQWAADISDPGSPVSDPTGAYCGVNQAGPVWFLAGNTGGTSRRACSVPKSKAILFPVINAECSTLEGDGTTEPELAACAKDLIDHVTRTSASLDGTTLTLGRPSKGRFRFVSPGFDVNFAPNNAFGVDPPGATQAVADGFWVLVKPLSAGKHNVEFHGTAVFPVPESDDFVFKVDVFYRLKIV
jgi:hypothetical protein